jgi:phosphoribosylformylglycinamidine synthase
LVIEANQNGLLASAKDLNVGGLAIALGKLVAKSGFGISVKPELELDIFSESFSRAVLEVKAEKESEFMVLAHKFGISYEKLGKIGNSDKFEIDDVVCKIDELQKIYFETFEKIIHRED